MKEVRKREREKKNFPQGTQFLVSSKPPPLVPLPRAGQGVPPVLTISELSLFLIMFIMNRRNTGTVMC
ncbi:unnamed protein product [Tuber melanosporum]|uniref:(Perigord truffle) hypothetical protein n=1 Tax=Tuber melanosporum (strain Mel28) TaxID=656061 RepID=D5GFK5_TUBMM|nr:uncharacterized protein GSTUM_00006958001 [Tuber melanosporum]CAZ83298.1 unnamed protein product [Tuber melanosporum]